MSAQPVEIAARRAPRRQDPDSPHAARADEAIRRIESLTASLDAAREERDRCIRLMHEESGMTAPQIGRRIGMSTSLVRLVLR